MHLEAGPVSGGTRTVCRASSSVMVRRAEANVMSAGKCRSSCGTHFQLQMMIINRDASLKSCLTSLGRKCHFFSFSTAPLGQVESSFDL